MESPRATRVCARRRSPFPAGAQAHARPSSRSGAGSPTRRARTQAARAARGVRATAPASCRPRGRGRRTPRYASYRGRVPAEARRRPAESRRPRQRAAALPWREPRGRSIAECAAAVVGRQRLGELVELALENLVELVRRELDAVIGQPVLGEVVRADLRAALARSDLGPAGRVELRALFGPLAFVQPCAQHAHRLLLVLKLGLLVLHRADDAA